MYTDFLRCMLWRTVCGCRLIRSGAGSFKKKVLGGSGHNEHWDGDEQWCDQRGQPVGRVAGQHLQDLRELGLADMDRDVWGRE